MGDLAPRAAHGSEFGPADQVMRDQAEQILRQLAGSGARLRTDQWRAIRALVVDRARALVVQRTGWGKSAVYFVATALLRTAGYGPTVIVSPLLALMRNQVAAAERAGIVARTINSANVEDWDAVRADVLAGRVDVLLLSPERLNNPDFRDAVLPRLAAVTGLLVVDEAHCISDWGHDFRPDYRRIATLLRQLPAGVPVLATTATANQRVVTDVAEQLALTRSGGSVLEPVVLRGSLDRASLRLSVLALPSSPARLGWLADHLADLPGSGIVYTLTVSQAEQTAEFLRSTGHVVAAYTGRSEPIERVAAEEDLLANRVKAVIATSALGMGFDKADLGFVVHLGAPPSPIAYYQQVGRAGRGVDRAEVLLLPGSEDEAIWRYYASLSFPPPELVGRMLDLLAASDRPLSTAALEPRIELARSRLDTVLKVLDVEGAVRRVRGGWTATGAPWRYDADRYARVATARSAEQQAMRDYIATTGCRMQFLRRQLDDPGARPCGRCDTCTGSRWPTEIRATSLAVAISTTLGRPGVVVEPRQMWPTALAGVGIGLAGRIAGDERLADGRSLARLSDLGWGPRLRELLADEGPDAPVPDDVFAAVVGVLADWAWPQRPAAVLATPSDRRPVLVASLADRIASVGRMRRLGPVFRRPPMPGEAAGRTNSAQRVRVLHDAFEVPPLLRSELAALGGAPVLVVDDLIDTGWTLAFLARELRRAGAGPVLGLTLGQTG